MAWGCCWIIVVVVYGVVGVYLGVPSVEGSGEKGEVFWESKLISDFLQSGYVREARPVTSANSTVDVTMYPVLLSINNINEADNTLTSTLILLQQWVDIRLKWNASDYGGVTSVKLPSMRLWLPDIVPFNAAPTAVSDPVYEELVDVSNDGTVRWGPLIVVSSKCPLDVTNFPFDTQSCTVVFGSWLHTRQQMDMRFYTEGAKEMDISISESFQGMPMVEHPYWTIIDDKLKAKLLEVKYGTYEFAILSITVEAKRRASFFKHLAIGPGALIGFLVPVLFLLPARSSEKNTFGMLIIVGLVLLISVLAEAVPFNHSSTPRVGLFYLITLMLTCCSMVISVLVSNISYRGARRRSLPKWIHQACLSRNGLRRILCIDKYSPVDNLFAETLRETEDLSTHEQPEAGGGREMDTVRTREMRDVSRYLKYICGKLSADDSYRNVNQDWEELARVVDRVLFVIFFILYVLTAVSMLTERRPWALSLETL
ncbi:neuronal acetylcholine receptor subunit beta-3-like [Haliotis rubra]|uniref:neuronal acetylcholine receptor subunit beta-3-like n=1 Tax=Haliotis rubra TaxID=36100 RepID=UPI001EE6032C|nr:neuronal acetylcholine receptor subunit beta-3-like [Haliotis rubra]